MTNFFKTSLSVFLLFPMLTNAQTTSYFTKQKPLPCLKKEFSVVGHITRDSLGSYGTDSLSIANNIKTLNEYFEPICAKFKLCEVNYIENFQYDTLDMDSLEHLPMFVQNHRYGRINLYYVGEIRQEDPPTMPAGISAGSITNLGGGGILLLKSGGALPHEMGHFWSLAHTFEGNGNELVNGDNCDAAGDGICDTPADPYDPAMEMSVYIDTINACRFIYPGRDANGEFYRPDVGNLMSYYPCSCLPGLTYEQFLQMADFYLNSNPKMW